MDNFETKVYEPDLGLDGTIPELVDLANRYVSDYSDQALVRISELAREFGLDEQYIQIPLLLKAEREREQAASDGVGTPYERMKIDWYLYNEIGYSESNFKGNEGVELVIRSEDDRVLIALAGVDEGKSWSASGTYFVGEFMSGDDKWLDIAIGSVLFYAKQYEEE